jgi:ATP-dependent DNA ligase
MKSSGFEALQLRVHPAASRVKLLSEESPASLVLWDLLCEGDEDLSAKALDWTVSASPEDNHCHL